MPDKQIDAIRDDVTATAQLCASAARELAQMAHDLLPKVSRGDPMDTQDVLQGIAVLTKMANEASATGRSLLAQQTKRRTEPEPVKPQGEGVAEELDKAVRGLVANLNERRGRRKAG